MFVILRTVVVLQLMARVLLIEMTARSCQCPS